MLGWDPDKHFYVPDEVYEHMNGVERGTDARDGVEDASRVVRDVPGDREQWDAAWAGRIGSWKPPAFEAGEEIATRDAGKTVMQAFKDAVPTMIGGAADLVESTKTEFVGGGLFSDRWAGRNIPFGIREHAMGSIVNGIGAHGGCVKPYGSTFLIFSDYMRPAVRLSALMELRSSGCGRTTRSGSARTGRRTSRSRRMRRCARSRASGSCGPPTRTRRPGVEGRARAQRRPGRAFALPAEGADARPLRAGARVGLERGAYTLWESGSSPDLILIATGAEVGLDARRRPQLAEDGTAVRVVSMPCWELFEEQPADYRDEVLPPEVKARLSIEPGVALGWKQWVGDHGELDLDRALRCLGAGRGRCSSSSATTSTTWSRARTALLDRV